MLDDIPTVMKLLADYPVEYRRAFHLRALELELEARANGQHELAEVYAEVVDTYLDAFDIMWLDDIDFKDVETIA